MSTIYLINREANTAIQLESDKAEKIYENHFKDLGYIKATFQEFIEVKRTATKQDLDDGIITR